MLTDHQTVPIAEAVGRVLARDVHSDLDLPPFEKSAMDGFAVHASDFSPWTEGGEKSLPMVGESRAGEPFGGTVEPGTCVAIYTGAEVPGGCDGVAMVETTRTPEGASGGTSQGPTPVTFLEPVRPGQNICNRGQDLRVGERVLGAGHRVRSADISVLASVGQDPVHVVRAPRVSILTTGDELISPSEVPGPGQIREGNTLQLDAMTRALGVEVERTAIVPDDPDVLREQLGAALESGDALITTGGVSMGKYDLVGEAFESLGVKPILHKVAIKPGKPVWFGMSGEKPVFALPGNPVSCLVGHVVFVAPALRKLAGETAFEAPEVLNRARWAGGTTRPHWREQYIPARVDLGEDGVIEVRPVPWNGSGDVVGLSRATAFAVLPPDTPVEAGQSVGLCSMGDGLALGVGTGA